MAREASPIRRRKSFKLFSSAHFTKIDAWTRSRKLFLDKPTCESIFLSICPSPFLRSFSHRLLNNPSSRGIFMWKLHVCINDENHFSFCFSSFLLFLSQWNGEASKQTFLVEIPQFNLLSVENPAEAPSNAIISFVGIRKSKARSEKRTITMFWACGSRSTKARKSTSPDAGRSAHFVSWKCFKDSAESPPAACAFPCFSFAKYSGLDAGKICQGRCPNSQIAVESCFDLEKSFCTDTRTEEDLLIFPGLLFNSTLFFLFPSAPLKFLVWS